MGTSSGEREPDNFVVADGAQERLLLELAGSKKIPAGTDVSLKSPKEEASLVSSHLKDSEVTPAMKFTEFQKVDENQDPLKDRGGKGSEGEGVLANKSNIITETQIPENNDGDLPSFSIKRLRRLPLRVASDQVCGTSDTKEEPMIAELSTVNTGNGKEPKQVLGEGQAKGLDDSVVKCVPITSASVQIEENSSREKIYSDPRVLGSGDGLDLKNDVRSKATARNEEQKQVDGENLTKSAEDGLVSGDSVNSAISQNDRIMNQKEIPTQPLEVGVEDPGDEGSQYRKDSPSFGLVESMPHNLLTGGQDSGNDLNKDLFEGREADLGVPEIPAKSMEAGGDSEQWRNVFDSYSTESISPMKPPALQLHVDDPEKENVAPATPLDVLVSSSEKEDIPEQVSHGLSTPASSTNTELQDAQPSGSKEAGGESDYQADMLALPASSETVMASPSGTLQILPPVIADTYSSISAAETTDEEDSPRGSIGFAIPDGEPDLTPLPYSGQIMYPGRYSTFQSTGGPSLLQYSGSMSLRSDSSTTSNRSFAFPVLAPEWNSSPVRMAKADPRYLRRRRRWDGCCFPRLGRSTYKY